MATSFGMTKTGSTFDPATVQRVWEKGLSVYGVDGSTWRKDACGAWINREQYGNEGSPYGWDVDHICPKALGGGDNEANLQPLQWKNNRVYKNDTYPWKCQPPRVTADGNRNVEP